MKRLIGNPLRVVEDMVEAAVRADSRLTRIEGETVLVRANVAACAAAGRVSLISGGGSGHEPAHAGYIGEGMLTAAVLGAVFTSPGVDAVLAAIRAVTGSAGTLLIVKNYTGDRLNFGLAAAIARSEGLRVEMVLVGDDVAVEQPGRVGRRGLAGTVLVHKVAGALAAQGASLEVVKSAAERVAAAARTMGVALSPCTLPTAEQAGFELADDEVEFGLGIHGEAGVERTSMADLDALTDRLLDKLVATTPPMPGEQLVLLVNGLGSTTAMEIGLVTGAALRRLDREGRSAARVITGNLMTALEMAGCSLTLLPVTADDLVLLDAPVEAPAWPRLTVPGSSANALAPQRRAVGTAAAGPQVDALTAEHLRVGIEAVTTCLIEAEDELTRLDGIVGDGDLGTSLARGARATREHLAALQFDQPASAFDDLAHIVRRVVGGTSGPLISAMLLGASRRLSQTTEAPTRSDWVHAFAAACQAVMDLGGAGRGDRTMLDALLPAQDALIAGNTLAAAAIAAEQGAERSRLHIASVGRSSYLGDRVLGHPDPGAIAAAMWLAALAKALGK